MPRGRPFGYLHSAAELNSERPRTNPVNGREEDLNMGPSDYNSNTLTTRPLGLLYSSFSSESNETQFPAGQMFNLACKETENL